MDNADNTQDKNNEGKIDFYDLEDYIKCGKRFRAILIAGMRNTANLNEDTGSVTINHIAAGFKLTNHLDLHESAIFFTHLSHAIAEVRDDMYEKFGEEVFATKLREVSGSSTFLLPLEDEGQNDEPPYQTDYIEEIKRFVQRKINDGTISPEE